MDAMRVSICASFSLSVSAGATLSSLSAASAAIGLVTVLSIESEDAVYVYIVDAESGIARVANDATMMVLKIFLITVFSL